MLYLNGRPHDPLQNHIRTVEDYLTKHKKLLALSEGGKKKRNDGVHERGMAGNVR